MNHTTIRPEDLEYESMRKGLSEEVYFLELFVLKKVPTTEERNKVSTFSKRIYKFLSPLVKSDKLLLKIIVFVFSTFISCKKVRQQTKKLASSVSEEYLDSEKVESIE
jgi:hypothetical protein